MILAKKSSYLWMRRRGARTSDKKFTDPSISAMLPGDQFHPANQITRKRHVRSALIGVGVFSCFINILAMTGPFFMLEVYDRVLPSRSIPTLSAFLMLAVGLYTVLGVLEVIRAKLMTVIATIIDYSLSERVFVLIATAPLRTAPQGDALKPSQDLDHIRGFLSANGLFALFDLPWMPIFLILCFLLHPSLGGLTALAMIVLIGLTFITDLKTKSLTKKASIANSRRNVYGEAAHRSAESIAAMGLQANAAQKWRQAHVEYRSLQKSAADVGGSFSGLSKAVRFGLQSAALAVGAYLYIIDEISAGMIVAASIVVTRTVAPIEQVIGNWRGMLAARQAWHRLREALARLPSEEIRTALPAPSHTLSIQNISISSPGSRRLVVKNLSFQAKAGTIMGILGASASGKSSLARAIVGAWSVAQGHVRLDGASLDQWSMADRGRFIGYMPQIVDLFPATIAENIARLDPVRDDNAVVAAAKAAGVHDMIVSLPGGYEFQISHDGTNLSAGQRQRIALARALYGEPFLVVLDEPNSNLDMNGDAALAEAMASVRCRGGIVIIITHRMSMLPLLDSVMMMENGMAKAFGLPDKVIGPRHTRPSHAALAVVDGDGAR